MNVGISCDACLTIPKLQTERSLCVINSDELMEWLRQACRLNGGREVQRGVKFEMERHQLPLSEVYCH